MSTLQATSLLNVTDYELGQLLGQYNQAATTNYEIIQGEITNRFKDRFQYIRDLIVNQALKTSRYIYKYNDENGLIICSLKDSFILIDQQFDKPYYEKVFRITKYQRFGHATLDNKAFQHILREGRKFILDRIGSHAFVDCSTNDADFAIKERKIIMGEDVIWMINFDGDNKFLRLKRFLQNYEPYIGTIDFGEFEEAFGLGFPRT